MTEIEVFEFIVWTSIISLFLIYCYVSGLGTLRFRFKAGSWNDFRPQKSNPEIVFLLWVLSPFWVPLDHIYMLLLYLSSIPARIGYWITK